MCSKATWHGRMDGHIWLAYAPLHCSGPQQTLLAPVRDSRLQPGRSDDPDFLVLYDGFLRQVTLRFGFAILALCLDLLVEPSFIMRCPLSSTSRMRFRTDLSIAFEMTVHLPTQRGEILHWARAARRHEVN